MLSKIKSSLILVAFLMATSTIGIRCQDKSETVQPKPPTPPVKENLECDFYLTKPDKSSLFASQTESVTVYSENNNPTIQIDKSTSYQEIDGFGFALTGGSAFHLSNMSADKRAALLTELFDDTGNNIGISYLRISIGASDLDASAFTYNDMPSGQTDEALTNFSIAEDKKHLIPVLKEILAINPDIKIMASPWSAPAWMKDNGSLKGGNLKTEYYQSYASYFVKYLSEMKKEGITIDAITIQNEPLHDGNNPSMHMTAREQANFVKNNLGPAFEQASVATKIIVYDHNADRTDYPIEILNDPEAKKYIDGSAFHLYGGEIGNLSLVHNAHPDKNLYFTEQWVGAPGSFDGDIQWHINNLIIGATRNWCKNVIEWNLVSNSNLTPHTDGGCTNCLGGITVDGNVVRRNPGYYIIAHASKLVKPGSVRIESNMPGGLPNVAFTTPEGKVVLIVLNNSETSKSFNIEVGDVKASTNLAAGAVGTFRF